MRKAWVMADHPYVNDVLLVGRLSGKPLVKDLPSGDLIVMWRLVVERPSAARRTPRKVVDTLSCVSFDERLRDAAEQWRHGDLLEVRGALRRNFWRTGSRFEIVADRVELCTERLADGADTGDAATEG
jgi:single-stranded DNA-binding protein